MSLIVNADDFGKSKDINRAISECFNRGYINRTTIMVNMPDAIDAVNLAQKNGFVDRVGLHINLTEGSPLSENIKHNPLFCNDIGEFNQEFYHVARLRLHMDADSVLDIEQEIEAQIKLYNEFGFYLNHIDSHHHVHTNLPVYKAIKNLSDVYKFSSIRLSRNLYHGGNPFNRVYKKYYNHILRKICAETTDYFGSFADLIDYFPTKNKECIKVGMDADSVTTDYINVYDDINKMVSEFKQKHNVEIMVHPMYGEDESLFDSEIPLNIVRYII